MEQSSLKNSLKCFVDTFHKYSQLSGHLDALNKKEMKQLVTKEMPNFMKNSKDLKDVQNLMEELDTNLDQVVDFKEFAVMMARLIMQTHEKMHEGNPLKDGHRHGPGLEGSGKGRCA